MGLLDARVECGKSSQKGKRRLKYLGLRVTKNQYVKVMSTQRGGRTVVRSQLNHKNDGPYGGVHRDLQNGTPNQVN